MASYTNPNIYYEEEEDQFVDMPPQQPMYNRAIPVTAAVDGPNNRFSQQQGRMMNPNSVPFSPGFAPNMMQQQQFNPQNAMQMQMLQIEMFKIQQVGKSAFCYISTQPLIRKHQRRYRFSRLSSSKLRCLLRHSASSSCRLKLRRKPAAPALDTIRRLPQAP
jgi:hypothetical protein